MSASMCHLPNGYQSCLNALACFPESRALYQRGLRNEWPCDLDIDLDRDQESFALL